VAGEGFRLAMTAVVIRVCGVGRRAARAYGAVWGPTISSAGTRPLSLASMPSARHAVPTSWGPGRPGLLAVRCMLLS
jgi:hypothetical protein